MPTSNPSTHTTHAKRQALRRYFRAKRNALPLIEQTRAAEALTRQIAHCTEFVRAKRIAIYLANDGEIDTMDLISRCWRMKKHTFIPILRGQQMDFARIKENDALTIDKWGLLQPEYYQRIISPISLDLILLPLVAFDQQGNRLGRGGGFYDRFLSTLRRHRSDPSRDINGNISKSTTTFYGKKPSTMGLSHHCQQSGALLPTASWDISMDAVVTDRQCLRWDNHYHRQK